MSLLRQFTPNLQERAPDGGAAPAAAAGLLGLLDLGGRCRLDPFLPELEVPAVVGGGR